MSGSDGEKDPRYVHCTGANAMKIIYLFNISFNFEFRFYRKPRSRDKDPDSRGNYATMRYSSATRGDDYDYEGADYDGDEEHYRDVRRKDRNTTGFADRRKFDSDRNIESMHRISRSSRDVYFQSEKDRYGKFDSFDPQPKDNRPASRRDREFNYETYEDTPHPNVGSKFNFEPPDQGFESDFIAAPEKSLRFSTDFGGEKEQARLPQPITNSGNHSQSTASGSEQISTPPQQKLRFDDKITVSKFDLFEDDDFSKAEFSFENEDQWIEELPKKINLKNVTSNKRHENIKKSESVNIFAKNHDDPFEDDDFFKTSSPEQNISSCSNNSNKKNGIHNNSHNNNIKSNSNSNANNTINNKTATNNNSFKWDSNFAKFDENI